MNITVTFKASNALPEECLRWFEGVYATSIFGVYVRSIVPNITAYIENNGILFELVIEAQPSEAVPRGAFLVCHHITR